MGRVGSSGGAMYMVRMRKVMANLNKEVMEIKDRSSKGLIMAVAFIHQKTEKEAPLVPKDLGNLAASWFVVNSKATVQGGEKRQVLNKTFVGPKATRILSDYLQAVSESQGEAKRLAGVDRGRFVIFGYGAGYAGFVHEMVEAEFKREGADTKWLEYHIKNNTNNILLIIKDQVKIPVTRKR